MSSLYLITWKGFSTGAFFLAVCMRETEGGGGGGGWQREKEIEREKLKG